MSRISSLVVSGVMIVSAWMSASGQALAVQLGGPGNGPGAGGVILEGGGNWPPDPQPVIPDTMAPAPITDLLVLPHSSNSLQLIWTATGDNGMWGGPAGSFDIRYSTDPADFDGWDPELMEGSGSNLIQVLNEPAPESAGTIQSMIVTGLSESTAYFFAMRAGDPPTAGGYLWSDLSNIAYAVTQPDTNPPGTVTNLQAVADNNYAITLLWTAPGDDGMVGLASSYDIRCSLVPITAATFASSNLVGDVPLPTLGGQAQSMAVTYFLLPDGSQGFGLDQNTRYYFAMKAVDDLGQWSGMSNSPSALTMDDATPPATITNLAVVATTPASITLSWTAPGDDGMVGMARQYEIRYSTELVDDASWDFSFTTDGVPLPGPAGETQTVTFVSGINAVFEPETLFYFAIRTRDEADPNTGLFHWSATSNPAFATLDTQAPADVTTLAATPVSSTSMLLTWNAPGDSGLTGTATHYDIRYSLQPIDDSNFEDADEVTGAPDPAFVGTLQNVTVNGLQEDVTYYFAMKTSDDVANDDVETPNLSGLSNIASGEIDMTAPAGISDLELTVVSESNGVIVLTWSAPGDSGQWGMASGYSVRMSGQPIDEAAWIGATSLSPAPAPVPAGGDQSMSVTGLEAGRTYYFAVRAEDNASLWSPVSNLVTVYFSEGSTNSKIDGPRCGGSSGTSATVGWALLAMAAALLRRR